MMKEVKSQEYFCDSCGKKINPATICVGRNDNSDFRSFLKDGTEYHICYTCLKEIAVDLIRDMDGIELKQLLNEKQPKEMPISLDLSEAMKSFTPNKEKDK